MTQRQFELHAQVDFCYWQIREMQKNILKPTCPIGDAIDKAVGVTESMAKVCKSLLETIVKCKDELKTIDPDNPAYDSAHTKEFIEQINKVLNPHS